MHKVDKQIVGLLAILFFLGGLTLLGVIALFLREMCFWLTGVEDWLIIAIVLVIGFFLFRRLLRDARDYFILFLFFIIKIITKGKSNFLRKQHDRIVVEGYIPPWHRV